MVFLSISKKKGQKQILIMEIIKLSIDDLTPYSKNAKKHPQEQIEQIKKSIQEFGMNDPIAIWGKKNLIVEGHGRLEAIKQLGYTEVECIRLDHLTDEERKAYTLAHNKLTMNSDFDIELLSEELKDIKGIEMSDFGFDLDVAIQDEELQEDEYEVVEPQTPKSKRGQVYQLGRHRLMCGDSTDEKDVSKLMDNNIVDLVVTDPPYNVDYGSKAEAINKYGYKFSDRHIENDYMPSYQFIEFLDKTFKNMKNVLKDGGGYYIWHASITVYEFEEALRLNNLKSRQQLIWVKNTLVLGRQDYQWKHEPCLYGWKDGKAHYFVNDRTIVTVYEDQPDLENMKKEDMKKMLEDILGDKVLHTTIIRENKPNKSAEHPTMKPVKLIGRLIENSSKRNEKVLDLFGGSGTTLIACEQLQRQCYIMEYDPKYVDVIIDRWEKLTGQKAELIEE